jgi:hypothetical protein
MPLPAGGPRSNGAHDGRPPALLHRGAELGSSVAGAPPDRGAASLSHRRQPALGSSVSAEGRGGRASGSRKRPCGRRRGPVRRCGNKRVDGSSVPCGCWRPGPDVRLAARMTTPAFRTEPSRAPASAGGAGFLPLAEQAKWCAASGYHAETSDTHRYCKCSTERTRVPGKARTRNQCSPCNPTVTAGSGRAVGDVRY